MHVNEQYYYGGHSMILGATATIGLVFRKYAHEVVKQQHAFLAPKVKNNRGNESIFGITYVDPTGITTYMPRDSAVWMNTGIGETKYVPFSLAVTEVQQYLQAVRDYNTVLQWSIDPTITQALLLRALPSIVLRRILSPKDAEWVSQLPAMAGTPPEVQEILDKLIVYELLT